MREGGDDSLVLGGVVCGQLRVCPLGVHWRPRQSGHLAWNGLRVFRGLDEEHGGMKASRLEKMNPRLISQARGFKIAVVETARPLYMASLPRKPLADIRLPAHVGASAVMGAVGRGESGMLKAPRFRSRATACDGLSESGRSV